MTASATSHDSQGTPYYQAPEVQIDGKRAQPHSDVWCTCLLGTEWFTGKKSWTTTGPKSYTIAKQNQVMPGQLNNVTYNVRDILAAGLCYTAKDRPTAGQIRDALRNPSGMLTISIISI